MDRDKNDRIGSTNQIQLAKSNSSLKNILDNLQNLIDSQDMLMVVENDTDMAKLDNMKSGFSERRNRKAQEYSNEKAIIVNGNLQLSDGKKVGNRNNKLKEMSITDEKSLKLPLNSRKPRCKDLFMGDIECGYPYSANNKNNISESTPVFTESYNTESLSSKAFNNSEPLLSTCSSRIENKMKSINKLGVNQRCKFCQRECDVNKPESILGCSSFRLNNDKYNLTADDILRSWRKNNYCTREIGCVYDDDRNDQTFLDKPKKKSMQQLRCRKLKVKCPKTKCKIKKKRKTNKFVYCNGKIPRPGVVLGHKNCKVPDIYVPSYMGWNWNRKHEQKKGWRPGAIPKNIKELMCHFLGPCPCDTLPVTKRFPKNRLTEPDFQPNMVQKPTLKIQKNQNGYFITMNPIKDSNTLKTDPDPYLSTDPIKFNITPNPEAKLYDLVKKMLIEKGFSYCTCGKSIACCCCRDNREMEALKKCLSDCEHKFHIKGLLKKICMQKSLPKQSIDIEFTAPAGIAQNNLHKCADVIYQGTQYDERDFKNVSLDVCQTTNKDVKNNETKKSAQKEAPKKKTFATKNDAKNVISTNTQDKNKIVNKSTNPKPNDFSKKNIISQKTSPIASNQTDTNLTKTGSSHQKADKSLANNKITQKTTDRKKTLRDPFKKTVNLTEVKPEKTPGTNKTIKSQPNTLEENQSQTMKNQTPKSTLNLPDQKAVVVKVKVEKEKNDNDRKNAVKIIKQEKGKSIDSAGKNYTTTIKKEPNLDKNIKAKSVR